MITNWNKYNQDLINRGGLDLNISEDLLFNNRSSTRGREYKKEFITSVLINLLNLISLSLLFQ